MDGQQQIMPTLHRERGEVNGAVLENGTILRLPPNAFEPSFNRASRLRPAEVS